eukprot:g5374.t1
MSMDVSASTIEDWVLRRVKDDVNELNELQYVKANYSANKVTGDIYVFIAFEKERFMLTKDRAESYMMDYDKDVCFQLKFGKTYLGDLTDFSRNCAEVNPKPPEVSHNVVEALLSDASELTSAAFKKNENSALSWYLHNRLQLYFDGDMNRKPRPIAGHWPQRVEMRGYEEPIIERFITTEVKQIMKIYDIGEKLAEAILKECDMDVGIASSFMTDNFDRYEELFEEFGDNGADGNEEGTGGGSKVAESSVASTSTSASSSADPLAEMKADLKKLEVEFKAKENIVKDYVASRISKFGTCKGKGDDIERNALAGIYLDKKGDETPNWQWGDSAAFTDYDPSEQPIIEAAYKKWLKSKGKKGSEEFEFTVKAMNRVYVANFKTMKQKNKGSSFQRDIRRMTAAKAARDSWNADRQDILKMYADIYASWKTQSAADIKALKLSIKYGGASGMKGLSKGSRTMTSTRDREIAAMRALEGSMKSRNVLIRVVHEVMDIFQKYTTHCLMCGCALEFQGAKPSVCNAERCNMQYNGFGLGVDIESACENQRDLMTLLTACLYQCGKGQTKQVWTKQWNLQDSNMCYPWSVQSVGADSSNDLWRREDHKANRVQQKGLAVLRDMVEKLPSIDDVAKWANMGCDPDDGRKYLEKKMFDLYPKNGLMLPLVRWIYTSNRAHIRRLRPRERISEVKTDYQFILMTGSAEKEAKFQRLKRETHFARELMSKWNKGKVLKELNKVCSSRSKEVNTLLCAGSSLYQARALLQTAVKAVNIAGQKLDEEFSHHKKIDALIVQKALTLMHSRGGTERVVKAVFDDYAQQLKMLRAANVTLPPSANASNAAPVSKSGSFWAWHGSAVESWHLILRTGLRNLSGTKLQAFGTAHGHGVYFGKNSNVSTGYASNSSDNWKHLKYDGKSLASRNTMMLALCEIINRPEDFTAVNPYFVVPNEDFITTRFVFLFDKGQSTPDCAARSVKIPKGLIELPPRY